MFAAEPSTTRAMRKLYHLAEDEFFDLESIGGISRQDENVFVYREPAIPAFT